jgi:hypothetical protein
MSGSQFSTESQQYAIDVVISSIREACVPLIEKMAELGQLERTDQIVQAIATIKLRLDTLAKVELNLLAPIKEEYAFIERSVGEIQPKDLPAMMNRRQSAFIDSIMQGL